MRLAAAVAVGIPLVLSSALAQAEPKIEEFEPGKTWHVTIDAIPANIDEFVALRDKLATTPQGGLVAFLVAGLIFGDNQPLGEQAWILTVDQSLVTDASRVRQTAKRPEYKGYQLGIKMAGYIDSMGFQKSRAYTGKGYVQGTKSDDGYALPAVPYKFMVFKHNVQTKNPDEWKGLSPTSGAENSKPYKVVKNDKGLWKVEEASSFFAGTKAPPEKKKDGL